MKIQTSALLLFLALPAADSLVPNQRPRSPTKEVSATPAFDESDTTKTKPDLLLNVKRQAWASIQKMLWPRAQADPSKSEPLPPGSLGCPFFGSEGFLAGNKEKGAGYYYREQSEREGHPSIVKFYFLGTPVASASGGKIVNQLFNAEFSQTEALSPTYDDGNGEVEVPSVYGNDNMMFERSKEKHAFLRRLVGAGMSPPAVKAAFPILSEVAQNRIHSRFTSNVSPQNPVKIEDVCHEYTMDIMHKLLLKFDLPDEEVNEFRENLELWLSGVYSPLANFNMPWITQHLPEYHARQYLQSKIEEKIDSLLENGPDASLISSMLFAEDEVNSNKKLTRKQVIENSLLLLIASSETVAGTLTTMLFLLALHPDKYEKVVQEQKDVIAQFGPEMTQEILQNHCPYLNAVKQETMRIGALTGPFPKRASETITIDGIQIPKGWSVFCNIRLTHELDPVTRVADNSHMCLYQGFQPERWLQEETKPIDFIPYGGGPRYCIGAPLAEVELRLFLATLARHVRSYELVRDYSDQKKIVWSSNSLTPRPDDGVAAKHFELF